MEFEAYFIYEIFYEILYYIYNIKYIFILLYEILFIYEIIVPCSGLAQKYYSISLFIAAGSLFDKRLKTSKNACLIIDKR